MTCDRWLEFPPGQVPEVHCRGGVGQGEDTRCTWELLSEKKEEEEEEVRRRLRLSTSGGGCAHLLITPCSPHEASALVGLVMLVTHRLVCWGAGEGAPAHPSPAHTTMLAHRALHPLLPPHTLLQPPEHLEVGEVDGEDGGVEGVGEEAGPAAGPGQEEHLGVAQPGHGLAQEGGAQAGYHHLAR